MQGRPTIKAIEVDQTHWNAQEVNLPNLSPVN